MQRLARLELDESRVHGRSEKVLDAPVVVSMMLQESEAREVDLALDLILSKSDEKLSRGQALTMLARSYIRNLKAQE